MNIIYIITVILLFTVYLLLQKKEEKQNFIYSIIISVIMFLTYNIFITIIMYFMSIKSTLLNLSIVNLIFIILMAVKIITSKKIQKYFIKKFDIIAVMIILVVTVIIAVCDYGIDINIKHKVTDATTHFFVADDFRIYSTLAADETSDTIKWFNCPFLMTGAYTNTGIFLKLFEGVISETYFAKLYFIFDIFVWILSGLLMYVLLTVNRDGIKNKILAIFFTFFYVLAYQLDSLFSGFSYLGLGLDIIIGIMVIMKLKLPRVYKDIALFLLDFGIMFSYYYFAPVVFLAVFWQIIVNNKKEGKKLFNVNNICDIIFTLIIPGLIGISYFIILPLVRSNTDAVNYIGAIGTDGFIYENLVTNIIPYAILAEIYLIYNSLKKRDTFCDKLLFLNVVFFLIIFVGMKLEVISKYYFYKIYYMFFIVLVTSSFEMVEIFLQKGIKIQILTYILTGIYAVGVFVAIVFSKNILIYDVYANNGEEIAEEYALIKTDEFEIFDYYNKNINDTESTENNTLFCRVQGNNGRDRWVYAITKNGRNFADASLGDATYDLSGFAESTRTYMVLLRNDYLGDYDKIDEEIEKYGFEILMQNSAGMILQKQNLAE